MSSAEIRNFYSSAQRAGELPYFVGKQYGSGWLKTLGRFALPILRRLGGIAMKTASDVITNKAPILPTLKNYAMEEAGNLGATAMEVFNNFKSPKEQKQTGSAKRRRPSKISINKRRKMVEKTIFGK